MAFSLDIPTASVLKSEARAMRQAATERGEQLSQSAALEAVAKAHGYRDWNTAAAMLPDRVRTPVQVGDRVAGTYLGQSFRGLVLGLSILPDMRHFKVTVKFDQPVDVVTSTLFSSFRQRVTATVDVHGVSPDQTSNGQPHMRVRKI